MTDSGAKMKTIEGVLDRYGAKINNAIQEWVDKISIPFLADPLRYHLSSGGKRIRPALCLYICEQLGGDLQRAIPFAMAVELLHNMFLLHDDIEDGDTVRRNEPTAWVKYGVPNAINAGDYLLAFAQNLACSGDLSSDIRLRLANMLSDTASRTIEGQALDINQRAEPGFAVEDYMQIARLKTGRYLVLGPAGGAVIAGATHEVIEKLWLLGENMGPAFQIRDDIIDLTQGKGRGGEIGCDIRESKPSILYAYALSHCEDKERQELVRLFRKPREEKTEQDVAWVIDLYNRYNILKTAQTKADKLVDEAVSVADSIPVLDRDVFRDVVAYMAQRTK